MNCHLQGVGYMHFRGWLYATHQTLPTMPSMARVDGRGLWRATFRPDIEHKPSEWGRVVVVRPFATNRGRLLAVAKLDGVIDYPNCRSRGRSAVASVGHSLSRACHSALPLDIYIIPHPHLNVKSFGRKILHKVWRFLR